jgi:hypothetical protein
MKTKAEHEQDNEEIKNRLIGFLVLSGIILGATGIIAIIIKLITQM